MRVTFGLGTIAGRENMRDVGLLFGTAKRLGMVLGSVGTSFFFQFFSLIKTDIRGGISILLQEKC
jgi:hypothetical protein